MTTNPKHTFPSIVEALQWAWENPSAGARGGVRPQDDTSFYIHFDREWFFRYSRGLGRGLNAEEIINPDGSPVPWESVETEEA